MTDLGWESSMLFFFFFVVTRKQLSERQSIVVALHLSDPVGRAGLWHRSVGDKDLEDVCSCLKGAHAANLGEWQCVSSRCQR